MQDLNHDYKTVPRLYVDSPLGQGRLLMLEGAHAHYLKNVLRKTVNGSIRFFNGVDGEWVYSLTDLGKKSGTAEPLKKIRAQSENERRLCLAFAPLKKTQMEWVVQKATELGATDILPIETDYTQAKKIRFDRWQMIAIEAAEQSERLTLPKIQPLQKMSSILKSLSEEDVQIYVAMERFEIESKIAMTEKDVALVVGPEGGWSSQEVEMFKKHASCKSLSLGDTVLRAETAAIAGLSVLKLL